MAVRFKTATPQKLLAAYKAAVDNGHVTTWAYDSDGDFTHRSDQWGSKAWLRPRVEEKAALVLQIIAPVNTNISTAVYAVYHARIIESMLRHCDQLFDEAIATSFPDVGDAA